MWLIMLDEPVREAEIWRPFKPSKFMNIISAIVEGRASRLHMQISDRRPRLFLCHYDLGLSGLICG